MIPLVWGPLIVPCPWAPEGPATPVGVDPDPLERVGVGGQFCQDG